MNSFRVNYPGGGRQHIKKPEIDGLLLARLIELREGTKNQYDWIGPTQSLYALSDLGRLSVGMDISTLRRFLDGSWIFELAGKRQRQLEETPESIGVRMCEMAG